MHSSCTRVRDLTIAEMNVFLSHIDRHKWFRHLDDSDAMESLNDEYGAFIRDMFCRFACLDRHDCELMLKGLQSSPVERDAMRQVREWDRKVAHWISVKKCFPCNSVVDVVYSDGGVLHRMTDVSYDDGSWFDQYGNELFGVVYWMAIPEIPDGD